MFSERLTENVRRFVSAALPFSNWGQRYFDIRLMELELADGLFNRIFSSAHGGRALDIGCGIGLASIYFADFFDQVDGTDIDEIGVAFKVDKPAPLAGQELIAHLGMAGVNLHCGDTFEFLRARPEAYDFIFSCFVLEHVEHIESLCEATYKALKPGGKVLHIVPNTHDTIIQLLLRNLEPIGQNITQAWRGRKEVGRLDGRLMGNLFTPITHSEFLSDYREQFSVNSSEHYLFPLIGSGFRVLDIKPMREHSYGILAEKHMIVAGG